MSSSSTSSTSRPPDLDLRIALLRADDDLRELEPSIWREFSCSSGINLDAFQDKILQPLMGWTRNYHTYYFKKEECSSSSNTTRNRNKKAKNKYYYQSQSSSADAFGMHDSYRAQDGERLDPTDFTLGDLFSQPGDVCYYAYDLGDHWYHKITCQDVTRYSDDLPDSDKQQFGQVTVFGGAMRCPDEDGEGGSNYQERMLDKLNAQKQNPSNARIAREYAHACFEVFNAMNVRGCFDAEEFSIVDTQAAVNDAIRSFISFRMGNKQISSSLSRFGAGNMLDIARVHPGQRKTVTHVHDSRLGESSEPFFFDVKEIVNWKPDDDKFALCHACGNPHEVKKCSRCHMTVYCSRSCQSKDWAIHKKVCKKQLLPRYELYLKEKSGDASVPQDEINLGKQMLKHFDRNKMRFKVGDVVECAVCGDEYLPGKVLRVLHTCEGVTHAYQVQLLDTPACRRLGIPDNLIWADWDHDVQIRSKKQRR